MEKVGSEYLQTDITQVQHQVGWSVGSSARTCNEQPFYDFVIWGREAASADKSCTK